MSFPIELKRPLVILDIESTGVSPRRDRIIELADGKVIDDVEFEDSREAFAEQGITYGEGEILLSSSYRLTEADREQINSYLASLEEGKRVTLRAHTATRSRKKTEEKEGVFAPLSLIRSKLPLKAAFRIGAGALKHKKFRLVMTILLSSLAVQTAISASADSTAARAARMVSGSFIPILGGSIAETLRTVSGGVAYLKNIFGIGGILMIFGTLAPIAISMLLTRVTLLITSGLADLLGCPNESRLLENLGETFGTMLAVCVSVSVMFILSLCIFIQSVIAVA
jgi:hypothetical protein